MRKTTCMAILIVILLTFFSVADGCARTQPSCPTAALAPFMGLPNDRQLTYGEANPEAPAEMRDVVVVTRVEDTSYGTYSTFLDQGRIVHQDKRDNFIFYAVEDSSALFTPRNGETTVKVTRRFSTRLDPQVEAYTQ